MQKYFIHLMVYIANSLKNVRLMPKWGDLSDDWILLDQKRKDYLNPHISC